MAANSKKIEVYCDLSALLEARNWSVEEAAEALGDSPIRLYRVLEGEEPLGRTATLATLALKHGLKPIE